MMANHMKSLPPADSSSLALFCSVIRARTAAIPPDDGPTYYTESFRSGTVPTDRETEAAFYAIIEDLSNGETAVKMHISIKTVEAHIQHLKERLDYANSHEMRRGLLRDYLKLEVRTSQCRR